MEGHRLCGLVRFSELSDGSWYAPVEPSCDVLVLIADHFAARFGSMSFAIHDLNRGSAIVHAPGRACSLVEGFGLEPEDGIDGALSPREREIRGLWRLYFETIAIESRRNPRLQMSHMPRKYWGTLTEMAGGRAPP